MDFEQRQKEFVFWSQSVPPPFCKFIQTRRHHFPVRPKSWASANCILPLRRWASFCLMKSRSIAARSSLLSSSILLSVFLMNARPMPEGLKSNVTPSASQQWLKGTHLSPDPANSHPRRLNKVQTSKQCSPCWLTVMECCMK